MVQKEQKLSSNGAYFAIVAIVAIVAVVSLLSPGTSSPSVNVQQPSALDSGVSNQNLVGDAKVYLGAVAAAPNDLEHSRWICVWRDDETGDITTAYVDFASECEESTPAGSTLIGTISDMNHRRGSLQR